jgi:hypothetical protein
MYSHELPLKIRGLLLLSSSEHLRIENRENFSSYTAQTLRGQFLFKHEQCPELDVSRDREENHLVACDAVQSSSSRPTQRTVPSNV